MNKINKIKIKYNKNRIKIFWNKNSKFKNFSKNKNMKEKWWFIIWKFYFYLMYIK